jgi:type VI secretion system protein ImpI
VGRGRGAPPGGGWPQLATGNFELSIEVLAFQGLRELAGSLLPGQVLETQGDVARFITRLHDAIDVLCRTLIPLRRNYLEFVSSMSLRKGNQIGGMALIDMARDPSGVAAALLDFREGAPEASKALEHALGELGSHQAALIDGVMQGVRALLDELSPAAITDSTEHKRGGLRIGGRQKDAWDEYCERYEHLSDEREAFARVFGEEFADAYRRRLR